MLCDVQLDDNANSMFVFGAQANRIQRNTREKTDCKYWAIMNDGNDGNFGQ